MKKKAIFTYAFTIYDIRSDICFYQDELELIDYENNLFSSGECQFLISVEKENETITYMDKQTLKYLINSNK